jgi:DNA-binding GntR family transcriptional regulator
MYNVYIIHRLIYFLFITLKDDEVMERIKLEPIKEKTTQEIVYRQVMEAILNGDISSEEIFTEVQLAELLNTSRTPVRGAVQDLVKEGLLVPIPRKGLTIRKITPDEQEEIFILRSVIEVEVIKKLIEIKPPPTKLQLLKNIVQKQKEAMENDDIIKFIDLDQEFHLSLTRLANYKLMEQVLNNLHNLTQLMGLKAVSRKGRMKDVLIEHNQIIKAIEDRDPELASKFILEHLRKTKETLQLCR